MFILYHILTVYIAVTSITNLRSILKSTWFFFHPITVKTGAIGCWNVHCNDEQSFASLPWLGYKDTSRHALLRTFETFKLKNYTPGGSNSLQNAFLILFAQEMLTNSARWLPWPSVTRHEELCLFCLWHSVTRVRNLQMLLHLNPRWACGGTKKKQEEQAGRRDMSSDSSAVDRHCKGICLPLLPSICQLLELMQKNDLDPHNTVMGPSYQLQRRQTWEILTSYRLSMVQLYCKFVISACLVRSQKESLRRGSQVGIFVPTGEDEVLDLNRKWMFRLESSIPQCHSCTTCTNNLKHICTWRKTYPSLIYVACYCGIKMWDKMSITRLQLLLPRRASPSLLQKCAILRWVSNGVACLFRPPGAVRSLSRS